MSDFEEIQIGEFGLLQLCINSIIQRQTQYSTMPSTGYTDPNFPPPNGPGDAPIVIYGLVDSFWIRNALTFE